MAKFDLCPKCGAVSRDGLCSSCGYKIPGVFGLVEESKPENIIESQPVNEPQAANWGYVGNNSQFVQAEEPKTNRMSTSAIVAAFIAFVVVCCGVITLTYITSRDYLKENLTVSKSENYTPNSENGGAAGGVEQTGNYPGNMADIISFNKDNFVFDIGSECGQDDYNGYDPQAYEFDTYIVEDVSYKIYSDYWAFSNEDGSYDSEDVIYPHNLILYGNYFYLTDTGLSNEAEINDRIFEEAAKAADLAEACMARYSAYYSKLDVYSTSYVTYMDSEKISIAYNVNAYYFLPDNSGEDEYKTYSGGVYISSVSFDLKTGKEIKASETFDFGGEFVDRFKNRCNEQNGSPIDFYSDDELEKILISDENVFWVYTPLGLEVGVNRPEYTGWSTGTFIDYKDLYK